MKKFVCFCLTLIMVLPFLNGCAQKETARVIQVKSPNVIYIYNPDNVDAWEDEVNCVVRGVLWDNAEEFLRDTLTASGDTDGLINSGGGWTVSTLEITGVIKGDVLPGDTLRLAEPYFTMEAEGETDIFIDRYYPDRYAPAEPGKEYIFFLEEMNEPYEVLSDAYLPAFKIYNRFPVVSPQSSVSRKDLLMQNLSETEKDILGSDETWLDFYQQAIDKYMK